MAKLWLKCMSKAPCLIRKLLSDTLVICCAPVGAVAVPLLPNYVWPWESSGNSCLPEPPDTSPPGYVARCTRPAFTRLCFMIAKRGDQRNLSCGGSVAMTVPWSIGSVASKTETKLPQLHYYRSVALRTSHWSFTVGNLDGMVIYNRPRAVSNPSQTFRFPALERKEGPGKHVRNVLRLMSMSVA